MHSYYLLPMLLLCPLFPPFVIIMPNTSISIYLFDLIPTETVSLEFLPLYLEKQKNTHHYLVPSSISFINIYVIWQPTALSYFMEFLEDMQHFNFPRNPMMIGLFSPCNTK